MDITWLGSFIETARSSRDEGRSAHALMLAGPVGVGKRAAALWLAEQHLGVASADALPQFPLAVPDHPDLRWVSTPEDKHAIGIDQIRGLVNELNMTSYAGTGKVAVIEPADLLTNSAANSLLKTLEEPHGNTLIILVADRHGRLPATIYSRCQHLNVQRPDEQEGMRWLQRLQPGTDWASPLREAGLAPLAALSEHERRDEYDAMAVDFAAVAEGRATPLDVAARWSRSDPGRVLGWMGRQIQTCILRVPGAASADVSSVINDSVLGRIDRRNLFCYLDIINRLRGQPAGSFNVQLTLECLLIDWAGCLRSVMETE